MALPASSPVLRTNDDVLSMMGLPSAVTEELPSEVVVDWATLG